MDDLVFPKEMGPVLGGRTFSDVFQNDPKWIECVDGTWTDNCSGIFEKFFHFIKTKLKDPTARKQHHQRCRSFVNTLSPDKVPPYLIKYRQHAAV